MAVDPYSSLMAAAKRANASSERDEIRWAVANVYTPLDQIDLDSIPSCAAVNLLRAYRDRPEKLFDSLYTKILPSKDEVNRLAAGSDDGVALLEHLDAIRAAAAQSEQIVDDE